jgi:hypothetical protein
MLKKAIKFQLPENIRELKGMMELAFLIFDDNVMRAKSCAF